MFDILYDFGIMYSLGYCIFVALAFKVCKYVLNKTHKANVVILNLK